jgi:hypothetical protein
MKHPTSGPIGAIIVSAVQPAYGEGPFAPCRGKVVPTNTIPRGGVLDKPSNLHGGQGASFLVQDVAEGTNKQLRSEMLTAR